MQLILYEKEILWVVFTKLSLINNIKKINERIERRESNR